MDGKEVRWVYGRDVRRVRKRQRLFDLSCMAGMIFGMRGILLRGERWLRGCRC